MRPSYKIVAMSAAVLCGLCGHAFQSRAEFDDRSARFAQATIGGTENLQKAPEPQRDQRKAVTDGGAAECKLFKDVRAARSEQDLAADRRDVDTQTGLTTKANDEVARQSEGAVALLLQEALQFTRAVLKQERARTERLERDLAAARSDVETQTALAAKASAEAAQSKRAAASDGSDLQKSLQQEHARADRLEQDLAAARREVETKSALVIKASDAAARAKQAAESGAGDLQKSLQQQHARAGQLEQDLAAARRDVEAKTALATKASAEAARMKQAAESGAGDLQKSLQQEHARADRLAQDLAAARLDAEAKTALAAKASDEAARVKQAVDSGAGDLQKSLQEEHARADQSERDLAAARHDVDTMSALVIKVSAAAARAKQAAASSAGELQKSLQQERDRAGQLEEDLAAARRDVETKAVLMMKASAVAARAKRAAESGAGNLQKSLQQERDRAGQLEQDLAATRRDVETQVALAAKASDDAARAKQAAENGAGELQKSLQQEHARADQLERDLATARRDVETRTELVIKASTLAAEAKQAVESGAGELQKSLQREHARADRLERDLAAARRDAESKTALATKANDEAARVKHAAELIVGELQKSLRQERDQRERLERNSATADHAKDAPIPPEAVTAGHIAQDKRPDTVTKPND